MVKLPQPPGSDTADHRATASGAPRWVKVFGVFAALFLVLFAILHLLGGGHQGHGG
jgi:hypothetical protein